MMIPKMKIPKTTFLFGLLLAILPLTLAPFVWADGAFFQPGNGNIPSSQCGDCGDACTTASACNPGYYCDNGNCYFHCYINTQQYHSCCQPGYNQCASGYTCDMTDAKTVSDGSGGTYKAGFCKENSES